MNKSNPRDTRPTVALLHECFIKETRRHPCVLDGRKHGEPENRFSFCSGRKKISLCRTFDEKQMKRSRSWRGELRDHPSCSDLHLNVNVSPRRKVLLHNSDLEKGCYISRSRPHGPDSRHLLRNWPLMAAADDGRPEPVPPETLSPAPHIFKWGLNQDGVSEDNCWWDEEVMENTVNIQGPKWDSSVDVTGVCGSS